MADGNARRLRRSATEAERGLWAALRDRRLAGFRFRRQHPVRGFVLDFACTKYRIAIEADGSQHVDSQSDDRRTAILERDGWRVLRFWNNDILADTRSVLDAIFRALTEAQTLTRSQARPATTLSRIVGEGLQALPGFAAHPTANFENLSGAPTIAEKARRAATLPPSRSGVRFPGRRPARPRPRSAAFRGS